MTALVTKHLPLVAGAPEGIKKLRELILELAIRGKLVPHSASDEPVDVLLSRISAVRAVAKLKSRIGSIAETELASPFNAPQGWQWVRLGELLSKIGAGSTPLGGKQAYVDSGVKFLRSQNVWNEGLRLDDVARISDETHQKMSGTHVAAGDILFNITGASIGRCAIVPSSFDTGNVSQHVTIIRPCIPDICGYLHKVLISGLVQDTVMAVQVGVSREGLSIGKLGQFPIPLPPLAEQHRIVAKVDELMALCDQLEADQADAEAAHAQLVQALLASLTQATDAADFRASWQRLSEHFHTLFTTEASIDALQRTVVDLAIKGKLDTADVLDEAAQTFISQARSEKAIAKSASGRRSKSSDSADSVPTSVDPGSLGLPDRWTICRVDDVAECLDYMRVPINKAERELRQGTVPYYGANGQVGWIDKHLFDEDLVLVVEDETFIGRTKPFSYVVTGKSWVNNHAHVLKPLGGMSANYLNLCLHRYDFVPLTSGTTGRRKLTQAGLMAAEFAIAPLSEQHRIVAKVDELMALCDQLKVQLAEARQQHAQLATVLVEQAVA